MIGSFTFNNVGSESFELVCKSVKRPLLPASKQKRVEIQGMSGAYDFDDSEFGVEYGLRPLTMKIQYIGDSFSELRTRARSIAAWLSYGSWAKLIINDEPDKYYLVKVTSQIDLDTLYESGSADVDFDCQPFAYSVLEKTYSFAGGQSYIFNNPGTRNINYKSPSGSKFKIEVSGSFSTLSLSLNGRTLNYPQAANGLLTIDNIEMEAFLGSDNKFGVLTGDVDTFLQIIPGNNTLTVSGTGLNITTTIKFIPMWM